ALAWMYEGPLVRHLYSLMGRLETVNTDLRRELEERQRAQAHAEAASRAKDVLLANMSHEFRTPLTAILGFTEILADEADPDHKPLLESIDRGGRRLLNTLNGVLDLAWIESNQTDIELKPIDAQGVVSEIASRFLPTAVERGLSFKISGTATLVRADAEALRRVVAAIIDNAIRFTERGSVHVSVRSDGNHTSILVSDTGIGMVPDFVEQAVQPFRQASEGDARTHEGVGVGLTVAERLLDMMNGVLTIDSHPGEGTTVTLQLPVFASETLPPAEPPVHELAA
ncbi:MAG: HAMP domain-containing sensor histidine kinase, partial [Bacteroidota bacterium]